jgi:hypothetical protein
MVSRVHIEITIEGIYGKKRTFMIKGGMQLNASHLL